jgi:hypothetical protein
MMAVAICHSRTPIAAVNYTTCSTLGSTAHSIDHYIFFKRCWWPDCLYQMVCATNGLNTSIFTTAINREVYCNKNLYLFLLPTTHILHYTLTTDFEQDAILFLLSFGNLVLTFLAPK